MAFLYAMLAVIFEWVNFTGVLRQLYPGDYTKNSERGSEKVIAETDLVGSNSDHSQHFVTKYPINLRKQLHTQVETLRRIHDHKVLRAK